MSTIWDFGRLGHAWIPMYLHVYAWRPWSLMAVHAYSWTCMDIHVSMIIHGILRKALKLGNRCGFTSASLWDHCKTNLQSVSNTFAKLTENYRFTFGTLGSMLGLVKSGCYQVGGSSRAVWDQLGIYLVWNKNRRPLFARGTKAADLGYRQQYRNYRYWSCCPTIALSCSRGQHVPPITRGNSFVVKPVSKAGKIWNTFPKPPRSFAIRCRNP